MGTATGYYNLVLLLGSITRYCHWALSTGYRYWVLLLGNGYCVLLLVLLLGTITGLLLGTITGLLLGTINGYYYWVLLLDIITG